MREGRLTNNNNDMKEHPILFSGPMVRAILDGRKTQTRRIVQWPLRSASDGSKRRVLVEADVPLLQEILKGPFQNPLTRFCPYGKPGDRLWVQENYRLKLSDERWVNYPVSGDGWQRWTNPTEAELEKLGKRKRHVGLNTPGRFMYRSLSRITLEIVSVRVERLQDITEVDAIAEGIEKAPLTAPDPTGWKDYRGGYAEAGSCDARDSYRTLWETINGPGSWALNPWVWVVEFKRVESEVAA